ncbi:MAG TPA: ATP-binding protein, partial [Candidatus Babeliales bacterium]|nr:ATP-binding protein [Candidatus Babeliales bacterium]
DKTKAVVGITDALNAEERLASAIYDNISPQIRPDIEIKTYLGKELILISVPHMSGPLYLKALGPEKGVYIRLGSTNRTADSETLQALKNFARNITFDELPDLQGQASDLDWPVIQQLFATVNKQVSLERALSLGLMTKHGNKTVPSNGGLLLFGKEHLRLFPEAKIRCARFLGADRTETLDQLDIDTYLPLAIPEVLSFIRRNTMMRAEIKTLTREDIPQYPHLAVREALMNAILHADYGVKGVYITIAIFHERLEITNPGGLPFGFTLAKALAGASKIRNRVIAKVFYHLKWIEQWGTGIQKIIKSCQQAGLAEPTFTELNQQFRVTLYAVPPTRMMKTRKVTQDQWQKTLLMYLQHAKQISTSEAAVLWRVTSRTARSRLLKLIKARIVRKTSTSPYDPFGNYVLASKAKQT